MAVQVKAKFKLTGWNADQLKLRVPQIMTAYGGVLDKQLKDEIKTAQFSWPRQTKRRNGTTATTPRDIVDLGGFLRSQRRDRPSATQLRFTWDAKSKSGFPYAPLILTGYTTSKGTIVPGRNWIKPALEAVPLEPFFAKEWSKLRALGL
jgi:hypothetical protein